MKELNLEINTNKSNDYLVVHIDGKAVELEKTSAGKTICHHQTENERVKIEVYKLLNVGGPFWFITQIFFYLITLFGLFGLHHTEKCLVLDFEIEVELQEKTIVNLQLNNNLVENQKAMEIEANVPVLENYNLAVLDEDAKKVFKRLKITKILLALAIVVAALLLIKK